MVISLLAALSGLAVAVLTVAFARLVRGQHWVYAIGLLTLPSLYASFAWHADLPAVVVMELVYGLPYLAAGLLLAWRGMRHSATVVAAFWIAHGIYDLVHDRLLNNPGVPEWYPVFCFTVDVVIGAYVLWLARRLPNADLHRRFA